MALSKDPADQLQEIEAGLRHTEQALSSFERMLSQYHGPYWAGEAPSDAFSPENHYHQYLSYTTEDIARFARLVEAAALENASVSRNAIELPWGEIAKAKTTRYWLRARAKQAREAAQ